MEGASLSPAQKSMETYRSADHTNNVKKPVLQKVSHKDNNTCADNLIGYGWKKTLFTFTVLNL